MFLRREPGGVEVRGHVDAWRALPNPDHWQVTPETARLLQHWRHHDFSAIRPCFCQLETVETAIWLTEVAPQLVWRGKVQCIYLDPPCGIKFTAVYSNITHVYLILGINRYKQV